MLKSRSNVSFYRRINANFVPFFQEEDNLVFVTMFQASLKTELEMCFTSSTNRCFYSISPFNSGQKKYEPIKLGT